MRIGIFDSGLGGLIIAKSIIDAMPEYDFAYLGDTANVPYGEKSLQEIYELTNRCVDYLFTKQDCALIIAACNTVSISALRTIQQTYIPEKFPSRRILGMVFPTVEEVIRKNYKTIGLIATESTVNSGLYFNKFSDFETDVTVVQMAAPKLVDLVESGRDELAPAIISDYIAQLQKMNPDMEAIVLGCTHYPYYKQLIRTAAEKIFGRKIDIVSQDEIVADSLKNYLSNHPEIETELTKNHTRKFLATRVNSTYISQSKIIMGKGIDIEGVEI